MSIERGAGIRYHGSQTAAHGKGYVLGTNADGRLTIHVKPDQADPWRPRGVRIRNVRPASVTLLPSCDQRTGLGLHD